MPASDSGKPRSTWNEWARVQVHPGAGVVDRRGNTLLVVPVLRADQLDRARALIELCCRGETGNPVPPEAVRALLERHPPGEMPGFALLGRIGGALRVLLSGPVRVLVDGRGPGQPGADEGRLTEHVLVDGGWHEVTVTAGGSPAGEGTA